MGGLVRYRENATDPLNPGKQVHQSQRLLITNQTRRRGVGGFGRYRGEPDQTLKELRKSYGHCRLKPSRPCHHALPQQAVRRDCLLCALLAFGSLLVVCTDDSLFVLSLRFFNLLLPLQH